jgi:prepilin-type N-terminal cleavage/methylation domain-containing protein
MKRGFTLAEMLVVVAIIVVLAAIAVPVGVGMARQGDKTRCLGNLRQIGLGLESYLADHSDLFPELELGRMSRDEDVPVLEVVLAEYVGDPETFHCPADTEKDLFAASGSSYMWNSTQNGRHKLRTSFFGSENRPETVPLVLDKEAFHGGEETGGVQMLYADYHISNKVEFHVSPQ